MGKLEVAEEGSRMYPACAATFQIMVEIGCF